MQTSNGMLHVGIVGASGYGGSELLRLLLRHPHVNVRHVTAHEHAGRPVASVHPNLHGAATHTLLPGLTARDYAELDFVFLALPHGGAMKLLPEIPSSVKVIDLSGDFRLRSARQFEAFYGMKHTSMGAQRGFVYGLPEVLGAKIRRASRIANPGCFATSALLALYPPCANAWIEGTAVVDAKTGSSGSGAKASDGTHHPRRANSFYAYKVFDHQHLPEIAQLLPGYGSMKNLVFQPHSAPMVRGILSSVYVTLKQPRKASQLRALYEEFYRDCPFVRLRDDPPNVIWVKNSNYADIGCFADGRRAVIFCALDNLVKGGAGQAVQNMNLMAGLDETTGLDALPSNP